VYAQTRDKATIDVPGELSELVEPSEAFDELGGITLAFVEE
jgi:hypothetical protein